jgi:hypothetical protein
VLFRLIQQAMVAMIAPRAGTSLTVRIQVEDAQLLVRLDSANLGAETARTVAWFLEDGYTSESLELVGAAIQHETLANGERISIVVPLKVA